jgi:hypothetical protein
MKGELKRLIFVFTIILFLSIYIVPPTESSKLRFEGYSEESLKLMIGIGRALAFVMGAVFSLMVGQFVQILQVYIFNSNNLFLTNLVINFRKNHEIPEFIEIGIFS